MAEKFIKTKYVNIDARFSNEFPCYPFTDYFLELQEPIHNVISLSIACVEIPITFHNICDYFENNNMKVTNMSKDNKRSESIIKLPDDHYTTKLVVEQINNELQANNINDLEFRLSKNHIIITSQKNEYVIDFINSEEANKKNSKYKLGRVLGFNNPTYYIKPDSEVKRENFCDFLNPRYLFLEVRERHKTKDYKNHHAFTSSFLDCRKSKYIIARITTEYHAFPFGSILTANLFNGFLISDVRRYKEKIRLEDLEIRLLNEFGCPICLNGFEISLCIVVECEE